MPHLFQCQGCNQSLNWNETPLCLSCRNHFVLAPALCPFCGGLNCDQQKCSQPWSQHPAIRSYTAQYLAVGNCHQLLRKWKSSGGPSFDRIVFKSYTPPESVDAIVPIPQRLKRSFELGRSPAHAIANALSRDLKLPVVTAIRIRKRSLQRQALLRLQQRIETPQYFEPISEKLPSLGESVVLVDDFMTSGHTLRRAADVLNFHGISRIHVFCLGLRPKIGS